jgi:DNA polymerase I
MINKEKLYIIDGMNMIFRHFFALARANLKTSQGTPVSAILGSAVFLHNLISKESPDYLVIAMDSARPTFRHKKFPDYKANRGVMDDDLSIQIPFILELFESLKCPIITKPGFEADDIIGSLSLQMTSKSNNLEVFIISGDKDFYQLVSKNISLYQPKKNNIEIVTPDKVKEKFSCSPNQVVDCLALIGDPSDNIPGVTGIGIKTAGSLISKFSSLDNLYSSIAQVSSESQRKKLIAGKKNAYIAKELITLKKDLDLDLKLTDLVCTQQRSLSNTEIINFYKKFEFNNLYEKALNYKGQLGTGEKLDNAFSFTCEKQQIKTMTTTTKVLDLNKNIDVLQLKKLFQSNKIKIGHNIKETKHLFKKYSLTLHPPYEDIEILDYLNSPGTRNHDLESCTKKHSSKQEIDLIKIQQKLIKNQSPETKKIYHTIELPLIEVLFQIEQKGVFIDKQYFNELSAQVEREIIKIEKNIFDLADEKFNINSPKQVQKIIYDKLKLQQTIKIKTIKTGLSTDESTLKKLSKHKIIKKILIHRELAKINNTYLKALPTFINPQSERIHTCLRQTITATGRLSSESPNLQNIPTRSSWGEKIRKGFAAQTKDHIIITADYSQIEIRILANFIPESAFATAIKTGQDIHLQTAAKILKKPLKLINKQEREQAKAINFGIIYGMGAKKLSEQIKVSIKVAQDFIDKYFNLYPEIKNLMQQLKQKALNQGYTQTILGRRRYLTPNSQASSYQKGNFENIAINSPIQGSAADIIKIAMIDIFQQLQKESLDTKMILQIHDELLFEGAKKEKNKVCKIIKSSMEKAGNLQIPLKVDIGWGSSWFEAKENS